MNPRVRMEVVEIPDGRATAAIEETVLADGSVAVAILKDAKFTEGGAILSPVQLDAVRAALDL